MKWITRIAATYATIGMSYSLSLMLLPASSHVSLPPVAHWMVVGAQALGTFIVCRICMADLWDTMFGAEET